MPQEYSVVPIVELFLGRKIRDEVGSLFRGEGRVSFALGEEIHRTPRFRS